MCFVKLKSSNVQMQMLHIYIVLYINIYYIMIHWFIWIWLQVSLKALQRHFASRASKDMVPVMPTAAVSCAWEAWRENWYVGKVGKWWQNCWKTHSDQSKMRTTVAMPLRPTNNCTKRMSTWNGPLCCQIRRAFDQAVVWSTLQEPWTLVMTLLYKTASKHGVEQ